MSSTNTFKIELFRNQPGDVNIPDMWRPDNGIPEAEMITAIRLKNFFDNPQIDSRNKPHYAHLVASDGSIISKFYMEMMPDGSVAVLKSLPTISLKQMETLDIEDMKEYLKDWIIKFSAVRTQNPGEEAGKKMLLQQAHKGLEDVEQELKQRRIS